jgi:hypothetical protein
MFIRAGPTVPTGSGPVLGDCSSASAGLDPGGSVKDATITSTISTSPRPGRGSDSHAVTPAPVSKATRPPAVRFTGLPAMSRKYASPKPSYDAPDSMADYPETLVEAPGPEGESERAPVVPKRKGCYSRECVRSEHIASVALG